MSRPPESWFVTRTMRALELLAFKPLSAPQVAELLQVHPRTARRLLNRLVEEGYLSRSEDSRRLYSPTMRIAALASQTVENAVLTRAATPFVGRLRARTGGSAHLMIPSYRSALCVVHSANGSPARPALRELLPCHCTAGGKLLLAFRDAWRESVLREPLERHTKRTITDADAVRSEAASIRERGYAVEREEYEAGVFAAAAPVFSPGREVVAALSASAAMEPPLELIRVEVVSLAHELSAALEVTEP
jgi:DNA-binding IclR family transcriptional regulator